MKGRRIFFLLMIGLLCTASILAGCAPVTDATPVMEPEQVFTAAAQTAAAQMDLEATVVAGATAVAKLTELAEQSIKPTHMLEPTRAGLRPTFTPVPTAASPTLSPTPTFAECNRAELVESLSIPDGQVLGQGAVFTKSWRVRNTGTCTWNSAYSLVFNSGAVMGGMRESRIPEEVAPGETIDLSVQLVVPESAGNQVGYWLLRSPDGMLFGLGETGEERLAVRIFVEAPDEMLFAFTRDFCVPVWYTSLDAGLDCPTSGLPGDAGWVGIDLQPLLEGGYRDNEAALILVPARGVGGYISGRYPALVIAAGDRFQAVVGCMYDAYDCSVIFQLNYYTTANAQMRTLGTWVEKYDDQYTRVDLSLNALAGQEVVFVLTVMNNGDATDDLAFWLLPRVMR